MISHTRRAYAEKRVKRLVEKLTSQILTKKERQSTMTAIKRWRKILEQS